MRLPPERRAAPWTVLSITMMAADRRKFQVAVNDDEL
jgi:hypothetical protein